MPQRESLPLVALSLPLLLALCGCGQNAEQQKLEVVVRDLDRELATQRSRAETLNELRREIDVLAEKLGDAPYQHRLAPEQVAAEFGAVELPAGTRLTGVEPSAKEDELLVTLGLTGPGSANAAVLFVARFGAPLSLDLSTSQAQVKLRLERKGSAKTAPLVAATPVFMPLPPPNAFSNAEAAALRERALAAQAELRELSPLLTEMNGLAARRDELKGEIENRKAAAANAGLLSALFTGTGPLQSGHVAFVFPDEARIQGIVSSRGFTQDVISSLPEGWNLAEMNGGPQLQFVVRRAKR